jgi:SAM-dependent methyltransferase
VAAWTEHRQGASAQLPFSSDAFDAVRSERLFQHLADPHPTLREMLRVVKPNGRIVVFDTDWGTLSIDSPNTDVERRLQRFKAASSQRNGFAGRTLYRLFKQAGLLDVVIESPSLALTDYATARIMLLLDESAEAALAAGIITSAEFNTWRAGLEQAHRDGVFYASIGGVVASGQKP